MTAPRNLVRLCAVTSALTLTGVGVAFAATSAPTPAFEDAPANRP